MSYIKLRGRWCHKTDELKDSFYEELELVFDKFPKYHMKILIGDFNAKVGSEDIFKLTIGNESATSKNLRARNEKREYLEDKINELVTNSKNKNIRDLYRGIREFKRGYQLRNNLVKDENGDLLADSHNILNRWKNYLSQLLNVHNVSDVRQIEVLVHKAEPVVPGPSSLEVQIAIAKFNRYKWPGSDQIPAELIQAGGEILLSSIHKPINSVWNKEELPDEWKEPIIVPVLK
jgi:hypothetical protein